MQILDWFLKAENAQHWAAVQKLATEDTPAAFETLKKYVLEACRFSSSLALVRVCIPQQGDAAQVKNDQGQQIIVKKGEVVLSNVVSLFPPDSISLTARSILTDAALSKDSRVP